MIYLDNAATSLRRPECVVRAVTEALCSLGNVGRGAHEGSLSAARTVYDCREKLCRFFGGDDPNRVCFTANATEALNAAVFGLLSAGDHVISTDLEHNSVLRPLYRLEKAGMELSFLRADRQGQVDYDALPGLLRKNTRALVCTHASNLTGNLLDIDKLSAFCREQGLLFILDAAQTAGSLPINVSETGVSVLCFTGHKALMGPQGTGGMLIGPGVELSPFKTGGSGVQSHLKEQPSAYPARMEAGTLNGHGIAGLSAALDHINEIGLETIHRHETVLMRAFYEQVRAIPQVKVYGDFRGDRAPIVSLNLGELDSGAVADVLMTDYGIAVRSGAHCAPRMHAALGTLEQGAVRFSFGWFNTADEVTAAADALKEIASEL
ncbi:MAG: aminotransferase class V-fold PLP-dependent enzyme [Firmicutes bacterium]|nr:aminotransferase class V-fold PLP-dependent enzyme [Bacillota bacterium]MBQ6606797.1 aminotransferase class V-fold PLP-dependent enzyme [Bacillota bacterium]